MSKKLVYRVGFFAVCVLLLISVYLQLFAGIVPCLLCTMQRLDFVLLGLLFFCGIILPDKRFLQVILALLVGTVCLLGLFLAARNIWLQHFPSQSNQGCEVGLQYMLQTLPFKDALQKILAGSADCQARGFEFLSLNMAEWALLWFALFFLMALYLLKKGK